jgi:hypothetical protein
MPLAQKIVYPGVAFENKKHTQQNTRYLIYFIFLGIGLVGIQIINNPDIIYSSEAQITGVMVTIFIIFIFFAYYFSLQYNHSGLNSLYLSDEKITVHYAGKNSDSLPLTPSFELKWVDIDSIQIVNEPIDFMLIKESHNYKVLIKSANKIHKINSSMWQLTNGQKKFLDSIGVLIPNSNLDTYDINILQNVFKHYYPKSALLDKVY